MSLVKNIQSLCRTYNTSIPKLEKLFEFSNGSMYNWDTNTPSIDKVQKVAKYFKVSTDFLMFGFDKSHLIKLINVALSRTTAENFAKIAGIDLQYLTELRNGDIAEPPTPEMLKKISDYPDNSLIDYSDLMLAAGYINIEAAHEMKSKLVSKNNNIQTIAAHHEGDDWTEEELAEIERFKEFVRAKKHQELK